MIRNSVLTLSLLMPLLFLTACDDSQKESAPQNAAETNAASYTVSGEMTYLARIALPPHSVSVITIYTEPDNALIFEQRTPLDERQVPIPFTVALPQNKFVAGTTYALQAAIESDSAPIWISDKVALNTSAPNAALGMIRLQQPAGAAPIPAEEPATESSITRVFYTCGDQEIRLSLSSKLTELTFADGSGSSLKEIVAASGVKYQGVEKPEMIFWSKGNTATLTMADKEWPECVAKTTNAGETTQTDATATVDVENPTQITGITWLLEDLNATGIIDNSHMTLLLDGAGRASGHAGCNRYSASYTMTDDTLTLNPNAAMTMMACAPALMEQEQRFIDALVLMTTYHFDETGALILGGGDKTMKFRVEAQEAPAAPQETPTP